MNDPIKAPEAGITLGTTSGYGRFVLDAENVTLEATAGENSGYKIVGWHVVYKDSERIDEWAYIHNTVANPKLKDKNNNDQGVVITYENSNRKSTFKLDKVFEDLVVAPVYDYIEYTIDISNFEGKLKTNPVVSTYKLGEEVSLTFNFKDELVLDLTKVKLNGDDLTSKTSNEGLGVGQFYKSQNNNNVTTGFEVKIKIADTSENA